MSKILGSLRAVDRVSAQVVANGIYISFQLPRECSHVRDLKETLPIRKGAKPGETVKIDEQLLRWLRIVRREVVREILAHRAIMNLPPPPRQPNRTEHQLSLVLR